MHQCTSNVTVAVCVHHVWNLAAEETEEQEDDKLPMTEEEKQEKIKRLVTWKGAKFELKMCCL